MQKILYFCVLCPYFGVRAQSQKFKRISLKETFEFPFWGLNICVDFDLRD